MNRQSDDWIRNIGVAIILLLLCAGAVKYLAVDTRQASYTCFIPTIFATGALFFIQIMQHIICILPDYDLATWMSISLVLLSIGMFYLGFKESDPSARAILIGVAGTFFGWGSGIRIGQTTLSKGASRGATSEITQNTRSKTTAPTNKS